MDILAWLWWLLSGLLGFVWGLVWFLLGGWVSALAQIAVIAMTVFGMKYGWQRAPFEIWRAASGFGRFFWAWLRVRDLGSAAPRESVREVIQIGRAHV